MILRNPHVGQLELMDTFVRKGTLQIIRYLVSGQADLMPTQPFRLDPRPYTLHPKQYAPNPKPKILELAQAFASTVLFLHPWQALLGEWSQYLWVVVVVELGR